MAAPLLDVAVETIYDAAVERLRSRTGTGQGLEGVKSVVRGDEFSDDATLLVPSVWVHAVVGTADAERKTLVEDAVRMRLVLTAVAADSVPVSGSRLSQRLALRALYELRHNDLGEYNPKLGFSWVDDILLERYELSTGETSEGKYGSAVQPIVLFRASRTG